MFKALESWVASATMEPLKQVVKTKILASVKLHGCIFGTGYLLVNRCPIVTRRHWSTVDGEITGRKQ